MKIIHGNLISLAIAGHFDLILHGCNCFNTMGSGIAAEIKARLPEAYEADQLTKKGDESKLGTVTYAKVVREGHPIVVVNGYTQYRYGRDKVHADNNAIRSVFRTVKRRGKGLRIGYPKIGAGLAGGDWNLIERIIEEELEGEDHTLVLLPVSPA